MSFSTIANLGKVIKAVKVSKKSLPNCVRRGLVESTRKPASFGLKSNGFHEFEADCYFSGKGLERIATETALWTTCICDCDDGGYDCYRCEKLEDLGYASMYVGCDSQTPTYVAELDSVKGAMRDGATWRRKSNKGRPSRVDVKKMNRKHREHLAFL